MNITNMNHNHLNTEPFKEQLILPLSEFPVDAFIIDNTVRDISYGSHWHDYIEIMFVLDGAVQIQHNEAVVSAQKNDIFIFHGNVIHALTASEGDRGKILVLQFLPDVLGTSAGSSLESKYIHSFMDSAYLSTYYISDSRKNLREIFRLVKRLYREFVQKEQGYEVYVKSCIYQMVVCFLRQGILKLKTSGTHMEAIKQLDPLLKYIEDHYAQDVNLSEAAKMLNLSYSYLSRYFKKVTGKNFKSYLDYIRICEAEKLILHEGLSVTQAAYEVGFSSVSSFNRVFKKVKDYTPGLLKEINRTKTAKK